MYIYIYIYIYIERERDRDRYIGNIFIILWDVDYNRGGAESLTETEGGREGRNRGSEI